MVAKAVKQAVETTTQPELEIPAERTFDLEEQIADELLNKIDWSEVHLALLKKAPAKLFAWFVSRNNTPVNLSPYPELAKLSSADEQEKAAQAYLTFYLALPMSSNLVMGSGLRGIFLLILRLACSVPAIAQWFLSVSIEIDRNGQKKYLVKTRFNGIENIPFDCTIWSARCT